MNFINIFGLVLIGWLSIAGPCMSQTVSGEKWYAISLTAQSVMGNIIFSPTRIVFQDGKFIEIRRIAEVKNFIDDLDGSVDATIYNVIRPPDLKLLRGNPLCAGADESDPITYIAVWKSPRVGSDVDPRNIEVFVGKNMPQSDTASGDCGGYRFDTVNPQNRQ